jgi:hypothetical protein
MIRQLAASLSAWYQDGRGLPVTRLVELLGVPTIEHAVVGHGNPGQSARIILIELESATFHADSDPSEAFAASLGASFTSACHFLSSIPANATQRVREAGIQLDLFIEIWMDNNQLDLELPSTFMGELARLRLPLKILSND